jgi:hypothetical protein
MAAPNWRPAWTSYWDDFSFQEYTEPVDLKANSITFNRALGGIDISYSVIGGDLPRGATFGLYWSTDSVFDASDRLAYRAALDGREGDHTAFVAKRDLAPPTTPGARHLILVLDDLSQIEEDDEDNNRITF